TGKNPEHIAAGDLNGDGKLDLAVGGYELVNFANSGFHTIMLNNGTGGFTVTNTYPTIEPATEAAATVVAVADLDKDGKLDLIGGAAANGSISYGIITVRRGNGDGTFASPTQYKLTDWTWVPSDLATGDLNGDGYLDVIATTPSGRANDGFNVLLNNKTGGFATAVFYPASQQTYEALAFDADKDGDLEVVTVAQSSSAITVHPNPGTGLFPRPVEYLVGGYTEAEDVADIDGDGDLDVVTNDDVVRILKNNGNGTFASAVIYSTPANYADLKLRDLNGDGRPDLLLGPDAEFPPYHFATALNNGNGTFAPGVVHLVFSCGQGTIDAFDLDNDGDLDVVLTEEQGCGGGGPSHIFIYRNDGAANLTAVTPIIPPGFAVGIDAADTNADGKLDLITSLPGGVGVFPGNGNLTFLPPLLSSTAPYKFKAADFNQDSKIDVGMIIPQPSFGTVYIATALGNGDGTFQAARQQSGSSVFESAYLISHDIDAGDLNGDGYPDVLVTNDASNDLSVFLTNPDGSLSPHQRYGTGYSAFFSSIGDLTGDGIPDIATVYSLPPSGFQNVVAVLRGIGSNPANVPPTVGITKPVNGARLRATRPVQATASAADTDGSIARVDFLVDGVVVGSATISPYRASFSLVARSAPYLLTARAIDNQGAETTSAPVSIRVR
ncbi:MAG: FG-GAP-like repeat-containing protein, partial [Verrucomicrobiota bacterium]|nr:FG-GAP-like repeat-containing protein [Verrucomicrobiota bacterium]